MDGLDIFNVYIMGSIEMLTVFHFFTRFLKKKVKFIYYILFAFLGMTIMMFFQPAVLWNYWYMFCC